MPEGDTIVRIARTLAPILAGKIVTRCDSPLPGIARASLTGHVIDAVETLGKNLLIRFDDGRVLRTHLRMDGAWHLYRPDDRWKRDPSRARIVLAVDGAVAVCFDAPVVEILSAAEARFSPDLASLGPDILATDFDAAEARRRLRARDDVAIGEAILDQTAIAGIGNVYKSEVLFVRRADPFAKIATLDDTALDAIVAEVRRIMLHTVSPNRRGRVVRRDAPGQRLFVYGRVGRPCFVCEARIETRRQGTLGRTTYFCRTCQSVSVPPRLAKR